MSEPDQYQIESARERLLQKRPMGLAEDAVRDPGSAFIAVVMGGGAIGLVVWLVLALLFGIESPFALLAGVPIVLIWISSSGNRDHAEKLRSIRTADARVIARMYCEEVNANENPDLWRALDDFRRNRNG